jgi:fatty-acyl-CoA synthase
MSETFTLASSLPASAPAQLRKDTSGRPLPGKQIKIVDPELGETVAPGASGEFCTRGYSVMQGYWNDPERTADAIDAEGWMHSGDLAVMDSNGYVKIVGRLKDMIIRGGENVYPREIEEYLFTHPDVVDAQVVGVPDERFGEQIMAWVQKRDGSSLSEADVIAFCRGQIAHFKVPRYVRFTDEFPMTVTGKIQKYRLREQAIEELGLDAGGDDT